MDPDALPPQKPKRRPRYKGTHPRQFHEKYKELNRDQFPETIEKILQSGKTPAGTHRPIMVDEILRYLNPNPGDIAVDATLGYGGHAEKILERILPGGKLIGIDQDPIEIEKTKLRLQERFGNLLEVAHTNYAALPDVIAGFGIGKVDVILADLGCSSMQLDDPERGFSFKLDGPLDMRMNPNKGRSAARLIEKVSESELQRILATNSDEPFSEVISSAIVQSRQVKPIVRSKQLAEVVQQAIQSTQRSLSREDIQASVRRVFQALRIEVNEEFKNLERFLAVLPACLKSSGRLAILTFHSGEDGRVKKSLQEGLRMGLFNSISENVILPSREEVRFNGRASSAKLRWAIRA